MPRSGSSALHGVNPNYIKKNVLYSFLSLPIFFVDKGMIPEGLIFSNALRRAHYHITSIAGREFLNPQCEQPFV